MRELLGLDDAALGISIADGQSSAGWVFLDGVDCEPWTGRDGPFFLHEIYQAHDARYTGRITVPLLWDRQEKKIVTNDSWTLLKMLCRSFAPLSRDPEKAAVVARQLWPVGTTQTSWDDRNVVEQLEKEHQLIWDPLLNGVYKVGVGAVRNNYDFDAAGPKEAANVVHATLDELEQKLKNQKYLASHVVWSTVDESSSSSDIEHPTLLDLRLVNCLLRFDASYRGAFGLSLYPADRGGVFWDGNEPIRKSPNLFRKVSILCHVSQTIAYTVS